VPAHSSYKDGVSTFSLMPLLLVYVFGVQCFEAFIVLRHVQLSTCLIISTLSGPLLGGIRLEVSHLNQP
jgi:hypothetical protein